MLLVSSINSDLSLSSEQSNFILQNNDQIFVRTNPNYKDPVNVIISGEVFYPGTYSLISEGDRVSDLILRSGGLTVIFQKELDYIVKLKIQEHRKL